jgi:hypothetical protein
MSDMASALEERVSDPLRVLFCIGVGESFFDASDETRGAVLRALVDSFANLRGRFGMTVLGTLDDDRFRLVPTDGWPWTAYILADVPQFDTAMEILNLLRSTPVEDTRLSRYIYMEARVGRRLFFGNE